MKRTLIAVWWLLAGLLLSGCNLPVSPAAGGTARVEPAAAPLPASTAAAVPALARLQAPPNADKDSLTRADLQSEPPEGFRRALIVPPGGFSIPPEECPAGQIAPNLIAAPDEVMLPTDPLFGTAFCSCGWGVNEQVDLTLTLPDGSQTRETLTAGADGGACYRFFSRYGMPYGSASLDLRGYSGSISHRFQTIPPAVPAVVAVNASMYYLTGFPANEEVLLVSYRPDKTQLILDAWKRAKVDARGELLVTIELDSALLAVFAGGQPPVWSQPSLGKLIGSGYLKSQIAPCGSAPPSRLDLNSYAVVTEGQPNNIRKQPGTDATVIGKANPGETLLIWNEQPVCSGNMLWWKVSNLAGTLSGWTVEGAGGRYWLAPAE